VATPRQLAVFAKMQDAPETSENTVRCTSRAEQIGPPCNTPQEFIMRSLLLWIIGVPISVILLLNVFNVI
jgi:hypothetical protein